MATAKFAGLRSWNTHRIFSKPVRQRYARENHGTGPLKGSPTHEAIRNELERVEVVVVFALRALREFSLRDVDHPRRDV
jgi:hypothetical protein